MPEVISSYYKTPVLYSHNINTTVEIDVYRVDATDNSLTSIFYITTLSGGCINCFVTLDGNSEMRFSASLEMVLYKNDFFIGSGGNLWFNKVLKVYKVFINQNGDKTRYALGFCYPNQNNFRYDATTKTISISGIDIMAGLDKQRNGDLTHIWEENDNYYNYNGLVLEGSLEPYTVNSNYVNLIETYADRINNGSISIDEVPLIWQNAVNANLNYYSNKIEDARSAIVSTYLENALYTTYDIIHDAIFYYRPAFVLNDICINLSHANESLPYDLEFNGDSTLFDVLKKIKDLYPNQTMYFDKDASFKMEILPINWEDEIVCHANSLSDLVISEQTNVDFENVITYVVVYGKNCSCSGRYRARTSMHCVDCDRDYTIGDVGDICPACGGTLKLIGADNPLTTDKIGKHKKTIYSDVYVTDEECYNAAKAECYNSNFYSEITTVTLVDNILPLLDDMCLGINKKIEYTSVITGETNVYVLNKLSHDFKSSTWTLEMRKFRPAQEYSDTQLLKPTFTYEISDTGLFTATVNNNANTSISLFKFYLDTINDDGLFITNQSTGEYFLGETCITNDNNATKTFTYQFEKNGIYRIKCKAYNPNCMPSTFSDVQQVTVNINNFIRRLTTANGSLLSFGTDNYLLV